MEAKIAYLAAILSLVHNKDNLVHKYDKQMKKLRNSQKLDNTENLLEGEEHIMLDALKKKVADWTRLELATSGVTGRHSNQLNYQSKL